MKRMKPNREGGYEWMRAEEVVALLHVLKEGGSRVVQRSGGHQQTITLLPQPQTWALVFFLVHTGARLSEAHTLRWADVDMERRTIRMNGGAVGRVVQQVRAREIPMCEAIFGLLSSLPAGAPEQLVFEPNPNLHHTMRLAFDCAGLPHYKLTALRETCASYLAIQGVHLEHIAQYLGCRSLKQVQRYAHLCPPVDLVAAMQSLNFTGLHCEEDREADPSH